MLLFKIRELENQVEYLTFLADRPFMFLIQDNEAEQILFMRRIMDPAK